MSRNRFRQILRYVHVVDNNSGPSRTDPNYDKLWKVRPILNTLSKNAPELYALHQQVSVDESMIGTKCRLSFIQYMPKKPTKWGIKVWVCSDARTGYIYPFDVYSGANAAATPKPKGQTYGVVMKLLEPIQGKGHAVYMDNFYSSPELFEDLLAKKTLASGTVRTNRRHFPAELKDATTPSRGDSKFLFHNSTTACRWHDNKDVYCLSTIFGDSLTTVKRQVEKEKKDVSCPQIVADYNQYMGGVDLADQAMCYYSIGRKTLKWWRRVFLENA